MKKYVFILVLFLTSYISANARLISGQVTCENGEPLIGVSILLKRTNIGTMTDVNGCYQITVDSTHTTLRYSYIGYVAKEIEIENDSVINVSLKVADIELEEFVITACVGKNIEPAFKLIEDTIIVHKSKIHKIFNQKENIEIRRRFSPYKKNYDNLLRIEKKWFYGINRDAFFKHIYDNINYPDTSIYQGIQGRVIVRFTMDLDGNIKNVEMIRSLDDWINQEVLSAFQSAPQLFLHKTNGRESNKSKTAVVSFILPVRFRIEEY